MAHCGVKYAALAVVQYDEARLVASAALVVRVRMSGGKHGHIFAGATEGCVEFIGAVHPDARQAFHDWVIGCASGDLIRQTNSMGTGGPGSSVPRRYAVRVIPLSARPFR